MGVVDHLRALDEQGLAELLRERPVLVGHCGSMGELARFVGSAWAQAEALDHTNAFEHAAAEVIAALGPVGPTGIAAALGVAGDGDVAVEAAVTSLERLLLATRQSDGRIVAASGLNHSFGYPLGLGRPLVAMLPQLNVGALRRGAELLGLQKTGSKGALAAVVSAGLSDRETVRRALAGASAATNDLVERLLEAPVVDVGYGRPPPAVAWLMERMMLVPVSSYGGPAELPREVALALRGPVLRIVPTTPPPLRGRAAQDVEASAAHRSGAVLPLLACLLDALGAGPAKAIQSGELGVRDLRRLAKAAETDEATAGRLLEMARSAGLVGTQVTAVSAKARSRWQPPRAPLVEWLPSTGYDAWLALDPGRRWTALATAWLDSRAWPSRSGSDGAGGKTTPAFSRHDDADEAPALRRLVLGLLAGLGAAQAAAAGELAPAVAWHRFRCAAWARTDSVSLTRGILAEAELLGVVAGGALSSLGRCLLDDQEAATRLAGEMLPAPVREILVQADLTAIAAGPLERDVAEELSMMADVESRGAATIWRFSEASVRRALDQGATPDRMLAFLGDHGSKGVPQPLRYLVNDAARRHGKLRVAGVASVVTSDDPALLAEVRVARKTAKLGLRELAPTVLASPRAMDAVLATLRAAGFLPAEERGDGTVSIARPQRRRAAVGLRPPPRPAADPVMTARRLLKEGSGAGRRAGTPNPTEPCTNGPNGADPLWWEPDGEEDAMGPAHGSAHDLLAEAVDSGAEVAVFTATGRNGTEYVGTVAMLTRDTLVLRDAGGRKQALALDSILAILEDP